MICAPLTHRNLPGNKKGRAAESRNLLDSSPDSYTERKQPISKDVLCDASAEPSWNDGITKTENSYCLPRVKEGWGGREGGGAVIEGKKDTCGDGAVVYPDCVKVSSLGLTLYCGFKRCCWWGKQSTWEIPIMSCNCTWTYSYLKICSAEEELVAIEMPLN